MKSKRLMIPFILGAVVAGCMLLSGCWGLGQPGPSFYERVVRDGSKNPHALYERGMEEFRKQEYDRARSFFLRARREAPRNPLILAALIRTELELEYPRRAISLSQEGQRLFPNDFELSALHALALMAEGRTGSARKLLRELKAETPEQEALWWRAFGEIDYREGSNERAIQAWRRSLELDPTQARLSARLESLTYFVAQENADQ